jgi:hypothetical protein
MKSKRFIFFFASIAQSLLQHSISRRPSTFKGEEVKNPNEAFIASSSQSLFGQMKKAFLS